MTSSRNVFTTRPELRGDFGMVASTHWLASAVGMSVLERGGNAADAAVAAGFVLQVVEPHLNGPGGEVPILLWDAAGSGRGGLRAGRRARPARASSATATLGPGPGARHRPARRHRAGRVRRLDAAAARWGTLAARATC